MGLPIEAALPELQHVLQKQSRALLVAPPGSGKTTRVPLAIMAAEWLKGRKIILLEPRRVATRSAARYMAELLQERVGQKVGYRLHLDTQVSTETQVEIMTEGILIRLLQSDPALEDVGLIIFDEFHERSLQADLGLALVLQAQSLFRPDLRILVMSATLAEESLSHLLGQAPTVKALGQCYPVETFYEEQPLTKRLEEIVVQRTETACRKHVGDLLVFLPGMREIHEVAGRLRKVLDPQAFYVALLYGQLPPKEQDLALKPHPAGLRKVVLTTTLAETSVTVDGVRIVVDCGWKRVPKFSPQTGLVRLETVRVSKASADQRRGRAGRQGPGICYRLWTLREEKAFLDQDQPEILEADLSSFVLELAAWGAETGELNWLDEPPEKALAQACTLLKQIGALSENDEITIYGQQMVRLGLQPRLAHLLLQAMQLGLGDLACQLIALLSEQDFYRSSKAGLEADLRVRLEELIQGENGQLDRSVYRRVQQEAAYWRKRLKITEQPKLCLEDCGMLLATAYPDRLAQNRGQGRFLLSQGRGAVLSAGHSLSAEPYLVAFELEDQGPDSRILRAIPISLGQIHQACANYIKFETAVYWDEEALAVRAVKQEKLGSLVLQQTSFTEPEPYWVQQTLLKGLQEVGLHVLPWTKEADQLRERILFLHSIDPSWPNVQEDYLLLHIEDWLGPFLGEARSVADLQKLQIHTILLTLLTWQQQKALPELAPSVWTLPGGRKAFIDYSHPEAPTLSAKIQELFGLTLTPKIAGGKITLTIKLLSPANRPVQVTKDLTNFWQTTYFEVKKELQGRYPKHAWPDDPLTAKAGSSVKSRRK